MSRARAAGLVLAAVALAGCGPIFGSSNEHARQVDEALIDEVVTDVLARLDGARAEAGARFAERLPALQEEAAKARDFDGWSAFLASVRATDPGRDLEIAERITKRVNELLAAPPAEEKAE